MARAQKFALFLLAREIRYHDINDALIDDISTDLAQKLSPLYNLNDFMQNLSTIGKTTRYTKLCYYIDFIGNNLTPEEIVQTLRNCKLGAIAESFLVWNNWTLPAIWSSEGNGLLDIEKETRDALYSWIAHGKDKCVTWYIYEYCSWLSAVYGSPVGFNFETFLLDSGFNEYPLNGLPMENVVDFFEVFLPSHKVSIAAICNAFTFNGRLQQCDIILRDITKESKIAIITKSNIPKSAYELEWDDYLKTIPPNPKNNGNTGRVQAMEYFGEMIKEIGLESASQILRSKLLIHDGNVLSHENFNWDQDSIDIFINRVYATGFFKPSELEAILKK